MDCVLDTVQSTSNQDLSDIFHFGLKTLAEALKDTHINTLFLRNNVITWDLLFDFTKHLQESEIVTLDLPRISEAMIKKYVAISKRNSEIFICEYDEEMISDNLRSKNVHKHHLAELLEKTHVNALYLDDQSVQLNGLINAKIESLGLKKCESLKTRLNWLQTTLRDSQISSIDLSECDLDCKSLEIIAPFFEGTKITTLNLSSNEIGVSGLNLLGNVLKNTPITTIDLRRNNLNCESIKVLASFLKDTKIMFLDLRNNEVGIEGLDCLAQNLKHTQITSIGLDVNCESLSMFAPHLQDTNVTSLLLNDCNLGNEGLVCLEDVLKLTKITSIELSSSSLNNCERLQMFSTFLTSENITSLNLRGSCLGVAGMKCLVNILKNSPITSIDLGENKLNYESLKVFLSSLIDTNVTALYLSGNHLGYDGIEFLVSVLRKTQITILDLNKCNLECNALMNLVMCLHETKIATLDLSGNSICCNIFYLAFVLKKTQITSLGLSDYGYDDYNPIHLLRNLKRYGTTMKINLQNLCILSLCYLGRVLSNSKITCLHLRGNRIEMDGLKLFSQGLVGSQITELDLSKNKIDDCGVFFLSQVLRYTRICSLNLAENNISCEGLKYLAQGLEGSQIEKLNLSYNSIKNDGFEYLTRSLAGPQTVEVDLRGNLIGSKAASRICKRAAKSIVLVTMADNFIMNSYVLFCYFNIFKYRNCFIEVALPAIDTETEREYFNESYKKSGITKLILTNDYVPDVGSASDGINITEIEIIGDLECDDSITPLLKNNNLIKLRKNWKNTEVEIESMSTLKMNALHLQIESYRDLLVGDLKSVLTHGNIVYLDLSYNKLGHWGFAYLVEVLKDSKIISLNLSNNYIEANSVKLLAQVLPDTKITHIDLHSNNIGYYGFTYLMNVVDTTSICWLSLGENNIEEDLEKSINLSPCIVSRKDTPFEFQLRFFFKELVTFDKSSEQFEFIIPGEDSVMTISHYAILVKYLTENSLYRIHIYDIFYMNSGCHDINVLDKINIFVKEISQRFFLFFGNNLIDLTKKFGYDSILDLVKECDNLNLDHFVEFLLLHRVFYYVDNEQNILHPFIYKMLLKHNMPLYNEDMEPNKKNEIISYFKENKIDGHMEIIDLLSSD
ncbi:hypothetical protein LSTR_LSTR016653 [Laodelphax striatellus]|nr:hypothetical protein LSTR_LSTR016653 [Laodelphax striatellus]